MQANNLTNMLILQIKLIIFKLFIKKLILSKKNTTKRIKDFIAFKEKEARLMHIIRAKTSKIIPL